MPLTTWMSDAEKPTTSSLKVTRKGIDARLVGLVAGVESTTPGATRSTARVVPEEYPEATALPAASAMPVPEPSRSSRTVPAPEREPTVTV